MTVNQLVVSEKKLEIIFLQKLLIAHDELMNEEGKMGKISLTVVISDKS